MTHPNRTGIDKALDLIIIKYDGRSNGSFATYLLGKDRAKSALKKDIESLVPEKYTKHDRRLRTGTVLYNNVLPPHELGYNKAIDEITKALGDYFD